MQVKKYGIQSVQRDDNTLIYYNCEHLTLLALEVLQEKFPNLVITMHNYETGMILLIQKQQINKTSVDFFVFVCKVILVACAAWFL